MVLFARVLSGSAAQHPALSPSLILSSLADSCEEMGMKTLDLYGDFYLTSEESSLRKLEANLSDTFGKEDAVFMPSGVMAQNIALLIHATEKKKLFACHHSSHLLLHEQDAYRELLKMEPIIIDTTNENAAGGLHIPAMRFHHVKSIFLSHTNAKQLSTLILETPHRELGGKLTPWPEVLQIGNMCRTHGVKYHCDGARIFEAAAGYGLNVKEIVEPFDSVYISFYKGLGGLSGAMLMGDATFCQEARVWLRRLGGNLYTLMPYIISAHVGYHKHVIDPGMTFTEKKEKLQRIIQRLSSDPLISAYVTFDPKIPETNMVHGYMTTSIEECKTAIQEVEKVTGIRILSRIRPVEENERAKQLGYQTKFEWTMGSANGAIGDNQFLNGWRAFSHCFSQHDKK
eukprot:scaffold455933_cov59-Attheya_sp.AAC.3